MTPDPTTARRPGVHAVHSVLQFVCSVPDLDTAEHFFRAFGLDVHRTADRLMLRAHGDAHVWGTLHASSAPKRLEYLSLGIDDADLAPMAARVAERGLGCAPHPLSDGSGLWLRNPDGIAVQLLVAPKVSPSEKSVPTPRPAPVRGQGAAPARSRTPAVHPRRLSHLLCFTPDVPRMLRFCSEVLGLRLSDHSGDVIAFMHGPHGSDHHLLAFAKSNAPGLHHSSWDVGSLEEVGRGSEQMRNAGYATGWGVGRHVLGSNYFYYVRDPWGSWAEYSFDIDFIGHDLDWPAADHPPEDSLYVWGPALPPDFVTNHEPPLTALTSTTP